MRPKSSGPMSEMVARTGCPSSPKTIPQRDRAGERGWQVDAAFLERGGQLVADGAGLADAGEVAFHVGHENRHADGRELLRDGLQGDRLAGAGGPGDQPVPVGQGREEGALDRVVAGYQQGVGHGAIRVRVDGAV